MPVTRSIIQFDLSLMLYIGVDMTKIDDLVVLFGVRFRMYKLAIRLTVRPEFAIRLQEIGKPGDIVLGSCLLNTSG
jgi:hypothetical protein